MSVVQVMREVKIVEFDENLLDFDEIIFNESIKKWKSHTSLALVRDVETNEIFKVYENQIRRLERGDSLICFVVGDASRRQ